MNKHEGVEIIRAMSREDFHQNIIKGICKSIEFSHLVLAGAQDLSEEEKDYVKEALARVAPKIKLESDEDFDEVARAIASRSVKLR